jgi:hypothetical protein
MYRPPPYTSVGAAPTVGVPAVKATLEPQAIGADAG